jgi:hypothetical protein
LSVTDEASGDLELPDAFDVVRGADFDDEPPQAVATTSRTAKIAASVTDLRDAARRAFEGRAGIRGI